MANDSRKPKPAKPGCDQEDQDAVDEFIGAMEPDEVCFESWCDVHQCLDLTVPLVLSPADVVAICEREVVYTRTVRWTKADGEIGMRFEKLKIVAKIPINCSHGDCLEFENQGDVFDDATGHLKLTIQIR